MKKIIFIVACGLLITSVLTMNSETNATGFFRSAQFKWKVTSHDFGKIEKDKPVKAKFSFTNTGDNPLFIISVKGSCGCTVAEYTEGEIQPGEKGEITATYNAAKVGAFNKTVTVNANVGDDPIILKLKGEVVE